MATTLRDRKKRETHRTLADAARALVGERGLEHVTVEEIAEAAGVSTRTFFNYFSGKDDALVGVEAELLEGLADDVRNRPATESPAAALRAVLLGEGDDERARRWRLRDELVKQYPSLLPRHLAATVQVEQALSAAVADRLGVDPAKDPTPTALTAAVLAAIRAAVAWWDEAGSKKTLKHALDRALKPFEDR